VHSGFSAIEEETTGVIMEAQFGVTILPWSWLVLGRFSDSFSELRSLGSSCGKSSSGGKNIVFLF
jgi:hypothetical protein